MKSSKAQMTWFFTFWTFEEISLMGSAMTSFALATWIYLATKQTTSLALVLLCATLPQVLLLTVGGTFADRFNLKKVLILAGFGCIIASLITLRLVSQGDITLWKICLIRVIGSTCAAFQGSASYTALTRLVPKHLEARIGGITQSGRALELLIPPLLAGALYPLFGFRAIILIDLVSFVAAVVITILISIPSRAELSPAQQPPTSFGQDFVNGFLFLIWNPGFLVLVIFFIFINFFSNFAVALITPMMLTFSSVIDLGFVQMSGGLAMLLTGVAVGVWGTPQRRMQTIFATTFFEALCLALMGIARSVPAIAICRFLFLAAVTYSSSCVQGIWQTRAPKSFQGRLYSTRLSLFIATQPVAYLLAGGYADRIVVPLFSEGGRLANWATRFAGNGLGMAFVSSGLLLVVTTVIFLFFPSLRGIEGALVHIKSLESKPKDLSCTNSSESSSAAPEV